MRRTTFVANEYYHLVGRGSDKQTIFQDDRDYIRFLFGILHLQGEASFRNISRLIDHYQRNRHFNLPQETIEMITTTREVELASFSVVPNHFHLLVKNLHDGGISRYMHRVLTGYSGYFNEKRERTGHVFQGPFRAVPIETNEQLLHVTAYIHRQCAEIGWEGKEEHYEWSSYRDFLHGNRWGGLLVPDIVLDQFKNLSDYKAFIDRSSAKRKHS